MCDKKVKNLKLVYLQKKKKPKKIYILFEKEIETKNKMHYKKKKNAFIQMDS